MRAAQAHGAQGAVCGRDTVCGYDARGDRAACSHEGRHGAAGRRRLCEAHGRLMQAWTCQALHHSFLYRAGAGSA